MRFIPGIFVIVCRPTQDVFVGASIAVWEKMRQHIKVLALGRHQNKVLQNLAAEYGMDNILSEFICECPPGEFEEEIQEAIELIPAKRL